MHTKQKPFNNQKSHVFIEGIVEVVLGQNLWKRIVTLKKKYHRLTFSWITRYCIFMLLKDKNFYKSKEYIQLKNKLKKKKNTSEAEKDSRHRHKVCLYGDDEIYLKYLSVQLGVSMSLIIRVALLRYLPELEARFLDAEFSENFGIGKKIMNLFERIKKIGTKVMKTIDWIWKEIKYEYEDKLEFQFFLFHSEEIF